MAIRPILDIDLSTVERFTTLFGQYAESLERTRPAWREIQGEIKENAHSFDRLTAALLAQTELSRQMGRAQAEAAYSARQQASSWDRLSRSTKDVAGHIREATVIYCAGKNSRRL